MSEEHAHEENLSREAERQRGIEGREGDMGVSSERVGPTAGGRGTIGTTPTYDDPAARPRSTGPNGSVPAPDEPIEGHDELE